MHSSHQPALPLFRGPRYVPADFVVTASNTEAAAWLNKTVEWPGRRLALWGEAGCGKTHLLHVWARTAGAASGAAPICAPSRTCRRMASRSIDADAADETSLFHLLNATAEAGLPSAAGQPRRRRRGGRCGCPICAAGCARSPPWRSVPPDDALLHALLRASAGRPAIRLPEPVLNWLLRRLPRTEPLWPRRSPGWTPSRWSIIATSPFPWHATCSPSRWPRQADEISGTAAAPSQEDPRLL